MRPFVAVVLCIILPAAVVASENSYKVVYDGGSLRDLKVGNMR